MSDSPENTVPEQEPAAPRIPAGVLIRQARERAGVSAAKLCADLRISPSVLEGLETGDYGRLAGGPYIRALLVSVSRYLRLDPAAILEAYNAEIGNVPAAAPIPAVYPEKEESKKRTASRKQLFILLLVAVLLILLVIMGRVNSSSAGSEKRDNVADTVPAVPDSLENRSLPDSLDLDSTSVDSLSAVPDTVPEAPAAPAKEKERPKETRLSIQAKVDSAWLRVVPAGARETSRYLRLGHPYEFHYRGPVSLVTREVGVIEITTNDTTFVPATKKTIVDRGRIDN